MNVSLTKQLEKYIRGRVKSGDFGNASEVVRDALRRVRQHDERLAVLRKEVGRGVGEADAGEGSEWDPAAFKQEVRRRVKQVKGNTTRRRSA